MLPIFPEGGLTSSVITTVWVGVAILAFFNLRFGWVLSGLVVPGYLVPLLILRPIACGVIVFEAVLTYLLVHWFSEKIARGRYNALFGRDRFVALVLASVAVRLTFDGWLLPIAGEWLAGRLDRQIDWENNLQSFGLVVISLLANQFWKPGLVRGLFYATVVTGLTWLVVRYGLMEFTNFRLSGVSYVYEGLASSILASPKAYIILLLTAFIASQMNVRYGWDFSGVLIPSLMALQWYQPTKILSSFIEAGAIYFLAQMVLRLPMFAGATIEGARKLLLFFNVSFAYKLVLGHILVWLALDVKTTDFYGFGYLLSTLLAIKAHDKDIFPRVMRSTFEISLAGAVLGNVAGYVLTLLFPAQAGTASSAQAKPDAGQNDADLLLAAAAGDAHLRAAGGAIGGLTREEADNLGDAIELLEAGGRPEFVARALSGGSLRLTIQPDGRIAIARRSGAGRDLLLFDPAATRQLTVVVPDAAAQAGLALAGMELFRQQRARWLVIAARPRVAQADDRSVLGSLSAKLPMPQLVVQPQRAVTGPEIALTGSAATALDLANLRQLLPGLVSRFPESGSGAVAALADNAVLSLDPRRFTARSTMAISPADAAAACDMALPEPPRKRSQLSAVPGDPALLAFLRFEIAEPLARAQSGKAPALSPEAVSAAAAIGLTLDSCVLDARPQWRLQARNGAVGTMLVAPAGEAARAVEAGGVDPAVVSVAQAFYRADNAGALLIAPSENHLTGNQASVFGVVSQALLRAQQGTEGRVLQVRPWPPGNPPLQQGTDIAVVPDVLETDNTWAAQLRSLARSAGFAPLMVDRSRATAGYEISPNLAVRYLGQIAKKRYATVWVPEAVLPVASSGLPVAPASATAAAYAPARANADE